MILYFKYLSGLGDTRTVARLSNLPTFLLRHIIKQRHKMKRGYTNGRWKTRAWRIWGGMMKRCFNPQARKFCNYGGRGITVSHSWRDFNNFYNDLGDPPNGYQIDRVDNNGNYCKENCRWIPAAENQINKRTSMIWHIKGKVFRSSFAAGDYFGRDATTIQRWCKGRSVGGYIYAPREDCFTEMLYK